MNLINKCYLINSLLGDLSSEGVKEIPQLVYEMRTDLEKIKTILKNEEKLGIMPGKYIMAELKKRHLTIAQLEQAMNMTCQDVNAILRSIIPIDESIARKLEQALNIPTEYWLQLEKSYRCPTAWILKKKKIKNFFHNLL